MKEKNRNFSKPLRLIFALIFAILVGFTNVTAQEDGITISGVVTDASDGSSIPGASVYVEGTDEGTITNAEGEFSLDVPGEDATVVVSFIGYSNHTFTVGDQREFEIEMESETQELDDVVVIGYGTTKKSDLTGSVSAVSSDEINRLPSSDLSQALQGRSAGMTVSRSGTPGNEAQIRIRGVGSINRDSDPIYVIDGVISDNMSSVSPTDIEDIQVLKDASAAAIYGADGSNGVVLITTKRGKEGPPKVNYSGYMSIDRVPEGFDVMNADEYSDFYSDLYEADESTVPVAYTDGFRQAYYGEGWQQGTDWQDVVTRTGVSHNHNLRISGGGESANFSVSANYSEQEGILYGSGAEKVNLRINSDFQLNDYIKIGESISLTRRQKSESGHWQSWPWESSLISSPLMRVYNEDNKGGFEGPLVSVEYEDGVYDNTGNNDKPNARASMDIFDLNEYKNDVMANFFVEVEPFPWLTLRSNPYVSLSFNRDKDWRPSFESGNRGKSNATLEENFSEGVNLTMENQVTFDNSYGAHNVTATAVHEVRNNESNSIDGRADAFQWEYLNTFAMSDPDSDVLDGSYNPFRAESYLGRLQYDYDSKYLITASVRRDGNSRFGPENRWGTFPSFSGAWKVSEDFLRGVDEISMLKLRFGWGRTGNSQIGSFQYQSLLSDYKDFSPVFGEDQNVHKAINVLAHFGNPSIKWESAEMSNFGMDLNMFNNQVQLSAEYYIKDQNDQLVRLPMPRAYGRLSGTGDPWINLGKVENRGFEFTGIYKKKSGDFNYTITSNLTTVKNEVKYIPEPISGGNNITQVGNTIGSLYGYVAERILTPEDFDPETGDYLHAEPSTGTPAPGDLKFRDLNNDGTVNDDDRTIIGKAVPDLNYSLDVRLMYRNLDFSAFFYGMQNFEVYNHLRADIEGFSSQDNDHNKLRDYAMNYYREDRPSTEYIRADKSNSNENDRISTWYVEDGSFLRLKDVQLGYTLSEPLTKSIGLESVRFYVTATNLVTITGYSGRDPESPIVGKALTPGNDKGTYPVPRAFTGGLQVGF